MLTRRSAHGGGALKLFRYERRGQPPVPVGHFARRLFSHGLIVIGLGGMSLFIGMIGYVAFERLSWLDAFLNAAMLLGGMGPIHFPVTSKGKLFAGFYALYSGLVVLAASGLVMAPVIHRVMHTVHWDETR
jgi:hypothetical protein